MGSVSVLRLNLFKDSEESFLAALDAEGIRHSRLELFSTQPQASGIVETISAISDAMPWNSIAKVMVAWIEARKSRKIIITTNDHAVVHIEGCSIKEVENVLKSTLNATVIDTKPESKT